MHTVIVLRINGIFEVVRASLNLSARVAKSSTYYCEHYILYIRAKYFQCFEGLADLDEDCPVCVNENKQVLEHLKSLQQVYLISKY